MKTLAIIILVCPCSVLFLSYMNNPISKTAFLFNIHHSHSDQIIQVGLNYANGYTGDNSIVISKDSIKYKCKFLKLRYDTVTPKRLWSSIISRVNINSFAKVKSGKTEQDRDGTDTIYFIKTKLKEYSFSNGHGKEFDKQKELSSILTDQFGIHLEKALAQDSVKAYR